VDLQKSKGLDTINKENKWCDSGMAVASLLWRVDEVRVRFGDKSLRNKICRARLRRRRKVVLRTLQYVDGERRAVEGNSVWKSAAAQQRRKKLLDKVHGWYDKEAKKIEMVLVRISEPSEERVATRSKAKRESLRHDRV
jgi:hypothetical protein